MSKSIAFPNVGIYLDNVGKTISVFGFEIAYYGIIIAIGMMAGIWISTRVAKSVGEDPDMVFDMALIAIICAIIGARIYYVAFQWDNYKDNLLEIFNTRHGGLAIYGGVIGGVLSVWIFSKVKKKNFGQLLDIAGVGLVLGQIIGRWGNFFNREAFGGYTDTLLAMRLPVDAVRAGEITAEMTQNMEIIDGVQYIQVHPTFLYESLWNIAVLLFLLWYTKRKKFKGEVFMCYLIGYGLGRAWIEGLRTDQLLLPVVGCPVSQLLSIVLVVVALAVIIIQRTVRKNVITEE